MKRDRHDYYPSAAIRERDETKINKLLLSFCILCACLRLSGTSGNDTTRPITSHLAINRTNRQPEHNHVISLKDLVPLKDLSSLISDKVTVPIATPLHVNLTNRKAIPNHVAILKRPIKSSDLDDGYVISNAIPKHDVGEKTRLDLEPPASKSRDGYVLTDANLIPAFAPRSKVPSPFVTIPDIKSRSETYSNQSSGSSKKASSNPSKISKGSRVCTQIETVRKKIESLETLLALTFPISFFASNISVNVRIFPTSQTLRISCGSSSKPLKYYGSTGSYKTIVPLLGREANHFLDSYHIQYIRHLNTAVNCSPNSNESTSEAGFEALLNKFSFVNCSVVWPCTLNDTFMGLTSISKNERENPLRSMAIKTSKISFIDTNVDLDSVDCFQTVPTVDTIEMTGGRVQILRAPKQPTSDRGDLLNHMTIVAGNLKNLALTNVSINLVENVDKIETNLPMSIPNLETLSIQKLKLVMDDIVDRPLMPALKKLQLKYNEFGTASTIDLAKTFPHLKILDLTFNSYPNLTIASLPSQLSVLNVSNNNLSNIAVETSNLVSLLDMSNNALSSFDFQQFPQLINVNLASNKFTIIPETLRHLHKLRIINLARNDIEDLRIPSQANSPIPAHLNTSEHVHQLDLSSNKIEILPAHSFKRFKNLEVLSLAGNRINRILPLALHDLTNLKILDLSDNRLSDLKELFGFLPNLEHLDISRNFVRILDFSEIPGNVQSLNLSFNHIENMIGPHETFQSNDGQGLRTLDLARNFITRLNVSFNSLPTTLISLNLSANLLVGIDEEALTNLRSLVFLALDFNRLKHLSPSLFVRHDRLGNATLIVRLAGNLFECDCQLTWLPGILSGSRDNSVVVADRDELMCHHRYYDSMVRVGDREVDSLSQYSNGVGKWLCPYSEQCFSLCPCCDFFYCDCKMICPTECSCYRDASWTVNVVRCDSKRLIAVPENVPRYATLLRLDGNNLTTINRTVFFAFFELEYLYLNASNLVGPLGPRSLGKLPRLAVLNLSSNSITDLPTDLFYGTGALEYLDLSFNSLSYLSSLTFQGLRSLKFLDLSNNYLRRIDTALLQFVYILSRPNVASFQSEMIKFDMNLADNPLDCTRCDMIQFLATNFSSHTVRKRTTCLSNGAFLENAVVDDNDKTLTLKQALKRCINITTETSIIITTFMATNNNATATFYESTTISSTLPTWWDRFLTLTQTSSHVINEMNLDTLLTTTSKSITVSTPLINTLLDLDSDFGMNKTNIITSIPLRHSKYWELAGIILAIILCIVSIWILCLRFILGTMTCTRNKRKTAKNKGASQKSYFSLYQCCHNNRREARSADHDANANLKNHQRPSTLFRSFKNSVFSMVPRTRQANKYFLYDIFVSYGQNEQSFVQQTLGPRLRKNRLKLCLQYPQEIYVTEAIRQSIEKSRKILFLLPNKVYLGIGLSRNGSLLQQESLRNIIGIYTDLFMANPDAAGCATPRYPDAKRVILIVVPDGGVTSLGSLNNNCSAVDILVPLIGHAKWTPHASRGEQDIMQKSTTSTMSLESEAVKHLLNHPIVYWTDELFWEKLFFLIGTPLLSHKSKQPITEL